MLHDYGFRRGKLFAFHIPSCYRCSEENIDETTLQSCFIHRVQAKKSKTKPNKTLKHQIIHRFYCISDCAALNKKGPLQAHGLNIRLLVAGSVCRGYGTPKR